MASITTRTFTIPLTLCLVLVGELLIGRVAFAEDRAVMRRLNRMEYENTIQDLLGVQVEIKELLPLDSSLDGFDNVGEALHVSSFLMEKYLETADLALSVAIANGPKPALMKKRYSLKETHQVRSTEERVFRKSDESDRVVMFSSSAWQAVSLTGFYPPERGDYRFRISTSAIQSDNKPVIYRVDAGLMLMTGRQHLVGYFDAPPEKSHVVEFIDSLEPRNTIRILPYQLASAQTVSKIGADDYEGPGLAIDWIEVEGPLHEGWPPASHRGIFGDLPQKAAPTSRDRNRVEVDSETPMTDAETILHRFARRAFRRSVTKEEIRPYVKLVQTKLDEGQSFEQSVRVGLLAMLVSSDFLFLKEEPGRLDDFALASRLSYFLWSTMPDETLFQLAEAGKLKQPEILREQVERMLNDPKAEHFATNFVGQWLNLRDIDFTLPSSLVYPEYDDMLKASMVKEAELFFRELLKEDLSLMNFVASDFSMLNGRLAKHYGIQGVEGWEFQKVALPPETHRGGVITMAGVLKVTANGTYTSPVTRGAWILDRILGTPPSPPPENVDGLVPDTRGATTIREQLAKHRKDETCASCHVEIDPPGFALENFDVIGGWRDRYRLQGWTRDAQEVILDGQKMRYYHGKPVDAADVLATGEKFQNIDEFKQILLKDKNQIARALTERLLTYATGAAPKAKDQPGINAIVADVKDKNYGFRSLIHAIVQSELFQTK